MTSSLVDEVLSNCVLLVQQVMKMEGIDNGKLQVVIMGFVAAFLSPLLAAIYVANKTFRLVSTVLPLMSIVLMLIIGLPVLTVVRWTYAIYTFIYNVLIHFYVTAVECSTAGPKCRVKSKK